MKKKFLLSILSFVLLLGISGTAASPLLFSGQLLGSRLDNQATPAVEAAPKPVPEDSARFEPIAAVLSQSDTGRQLLKLKEINAVIVQFEEGRGSRYRKGSNLILLDIQHNPIKAALCFAHEMIHARTFNEGKSADIESESRQDYINLKIQEEVEGMIASFMVKMELEQIGLQVAHITLPMEDAYQHAYQAATKQASSLDSSLSEQQLDTIGRAAGELALFDTFLGGGIRGSKSHEPYTEKFAKRWDAANGS